MNIKNLYLVIYVLIFLITSCSYNKNTPESKIKIENENTIEPQSETLSSLKNAEIYRKKGYILDSKIAIYNNSFNLIDSLFITEDVAQINILEKTKTMITQSGDTLNNPCPTANFLKIQYNDKEYITYGIDIYEEIADETFDFKNDLNSISISAIKNFSVGFSGFGELTGCDDYHPLIIIERDKIYKIRTIPRKGFEYYAQENNLDYYYLVSDDGVRENITNAFLKGDTIVAKIHVDYQDGHSDYELNITKNKEKYHSTISNETLPSFD